MRTIRHIIALLALALLPLTTSCATTSSTVLVYSGGGAFDEHGKALSIDEFLPDNTGKNQSIVLRVDNPKETAVEFLTIMVRPCIKKGYSKFILIDAQYNRLASFRVAGAAELWLAHRMGENKLLPTKETGIGRINSDSIIIELEPGSTQITEVMQVTVYPDVPISQLCNCLNLLQKFGCQRVAIAAVPPENPETPR